MSAAWKDTWNKFDWQMSEWIAASYTENWTGWLRTIGLARKAANGSTRKLSNQEHPLPEMLLFLLQNLITYAPGRCSQDAWNMQSYEIFACMYPASKPQNTYAGLKLRRVTIFFKGLFFCGFSAPTKQNIWRISPWSTCLRALKKKDDYYSGEARICNSCGMSLPLARERAFFKHPSAVDCTSRSWSFSSAPNSRACSPAIYNTVASIVYIQVWGKIFNQLL